MSSRTVDSWSIGLDRIACRVYKRHHASSCYCHPWQSRLCVPSSLPTPSVTRLATRPLRVHREEERHIIAGAALPVSRLTFPLKLFIYNTKWMVGGQGERAVSRHCQHCCLLVTGNWQLYSRFHRPHSWSLASALLTFSSSPCLSTLFFLLQVSVLFRKSPASYLLLTDSHCTSGLLSDTAEDGDPTGQSAPWRWPLIPFFYYFFFFFFF